VQLSAECRDILKRLLTPNSAERICIEDIKRHAWYLKDLPDGALEMNDFYVTAVSQMRLQEVTRHSADLLLAFHTLAISPPGE
jgi:hypothetical protein